MRMNAHRYVFTCTPSLSHYCRDPVLGRLPPANLMLFLNLRGQTWTRRGLNQSRVAPLGVAINPLGGGTTLNLGRNTRLAKPLGAKTPKLGGGGAENKLFANGVSLASYKNCQRTQLASALWRPPVHGVPSLGRWACFFYGGVLY